MYLLTLAAFAFIIAMVPFSVALSSSVYRCIQWKEGFRIALVFAMFHAVMAAVGWGAGYSVKPWLHTMAVPVSLFIFFFMALRFFVDARRKGPESRTLVVENMRILVGFAIVTGINTLLLSISLGLLYPGVLKLAGIVFAMVFLITLVGIRTGKKARMNTGRVAETIGSMLLTVISIFILLQYLKIL